MSRFSFIATFFFIFMPHINRAKEFDTADMGLRFFMNILLAPVAWLIFQLFIGVFLRKKVTKDYFEKALNICFAPLYLVVFYFSVFLNRGMAFKKTTYEYLFMTSLALLVGTVIGVIFWASKNWSKQNQDQRKDSEFYSLKEWLKLVFQKFLRSYLSIAKPINTKPVYLPFVFKSLILLNFFVLVEFGLYSYSNIFQLFFAITFSILFVYGIARVIIFITVGNRALIMLISSIFIFVYFIYVIFSINQGYLFDISLFLQNKTILFNRDSFALFRSKADSLVVSFAIILVAWIISNVIFRKDEKIKPIKVKEFFVIVPVLVLPFISSIVIPDVISYLNKSVSRYYSQQKIIDKVKNNIGTQHIYEHKKRTVIPKQLPNIIILTVESFNGVLPGKTFNGKQVTPFLKTLEKKGVVVEHFYGNSIQTARGLFAVYSGVLPSYRKKVFTSMSDIQLYALPQLLQDAGYQTIHFNAHESHSFDNAETMLKKLGFEKTIFGDKDFVKNVPQEKFWGWGIQDDEFYKLVFNKMDVIKEEPFMIGIMTISNHMMFDEIPNEQKYIYPNAGSKDFKKNIVNSLHLVDRNLKVFWDELQKRKWAKNTIVVITGDHSFPHGQGSRDSEVGSFEGNFKIPLLLIYPKKLKPAKIAQVTFSQIDITPTLLDVIGIQHDNHFMGKSIFKTQKNTALLSQPYNGTYLVATQYPYKLVYSQTDNGLYLYNLEKDPLETKNLIYQKKLANIRDELRSDIDKIVINQYLLENNLIWSGDSPNKKNKQ